ncbi:MAG TPA: phosphopantetheine-binding protein [Bryobacteraceae bacterium]|nr:phosphopantetheine-binding protein [Bryobacteraceae bacterium]
MPPIETAIRDFLRDFLFLADADNLSGDDSFLEKGIVDSMGILHLITFVQQKYAIDVKDDELVTDNWDSIDRMSRYIRRKLGAGEMEPGSLLAQSATALPAAQ